MSIKEDFSVTSLCFRPHKCIRYRGLYCLVLPDLINLWADQWFIYRAQAATLPPVPTFVRLIQFWWHSSTTFKLGQPHTKVCLEHIPDLAQWHHHDVQQHDSFIHPTGETINGEQTFNKGQYIDCRPGTITLIPKTHISCEQCSTSAQHCKPETNFSECQA